MIIFLAAFQTVAQDSLKHFDYSSKVEHYRKVQKGGKLATLIGLSSASVGVVIMATSFWEHGPPDADFPYTMGAGLFIIGTAGTLVGIPVWINGANKKRKYQGKLEGLHVSIYGTGGIRLVYKF